VDLGEGTTRETARLAAVRRRSAARGSRQTR